MKVGKVSIEETGVVVGEACRVCGKAIAAMPLNEALCCSCRYGEHSWRDAAKEPVDSLDYMRGGRMGTRLSSGFRRILRHED